MQISSATDAPAAWTIGTNSTGCSAWLSVIAALTDGDSGVSSLTHEADAWREGEVVNVQFEDVDVALLGATLSSLKDAASRSARAKSAKIETVTLHSCTLLDTSQERERHGKGQPRSPSVSPA